MSTLSSSVDFDSQPAAGQEQGILQEQQQQQQQQVQQLPAATTASAASSRKKDSGHVGEKDNLDFFPAKFPSANFFNISTTSTSSTSGKTINDMSSSSTPKNAWDGNLITHKPFHLSPSREEVADIMRRTLLFRLPKQGRFGLYTREHFAEAFRSRGMPLESIESSGPLFQRPNDWNLTIRRGYDAVLRSLMFEPFRVNGQVARISSVIKTLVRVRIHGLPYYIPQAVVEDKLREYGNVEEAGEFESTRTESLKGSKTLARTFIMTVKTFEGIPHFWPVTFMGQLFNCLITVHGRPPMCLQCKKEGHISRDCPTPYCSLCKQYDHKRDECPTLGESFAQLMERGRAVDYVGDEFAVCRDVIEQREMNKAGGRKDAKVRRTVSDGEEEFEVEKALDKKKLVEDLNRGMDLVVARMGKGSLSHRGGYVPDENAVMMRKGFRALVEYGEEEDSAENHDGQVQQVRSKVGVKDVEVQKSAEGSKSEGAQKKGPKSEGAQKKGPKSEEAQKKGPKSEEVQKKEGSEKDGGSDEKATLEEVKVLKRKEREDDSGEEGDVKNLKKDGQGVGKQFVSDTESDVGDEGDETMDAASVGSERSVEKITESEEMLEDGQRFFSADDDDDDEGKLVIVESVPVEEEMKEDQKEELEEEVKEREQEVAVKDLEVDEVVEGMAKNEDKEARVVVLGKKDVVDEVMDLGDEDLDKKVLATRRKGSGAKLVAGRGKPRV